ncbi:plasma membrane zinc ion transporter [Histoplasma capsulatum G186AR]|uniref:Plasma membrane zinc ion transporter n=1 Tax=Ajellomyces capsulatus TaxID=5037 RepID=A0A8H8CTZ2_AJECA|nr:plasma membrane zinc ion transporter [Histoplasma capsulatum]QSS72509.1 plasma membrane zinc ion transporter [Histoplasma capsulatum G186AR]
MNCPSRTDESPGHPQWNQNPPSLTADLTTCEDLNGTVNSRSYRNRDSHLRCDSTQNPDSLMGRPPSENHRPPVRSERGAESGCPFSNKEDTYSLTRALLPGKGHATSWPIGIYQRSRRNRAWIWRIALVLLFATLSFSFGSAVLSYASTVKSKLANKLPTRGLQRRGTCSNNPATESQYNTPLHVGSLLIILFISSLACSFPLMSIKFSFLRIPSWFLFLVRHFGTGVLIATAFVHLLPTAFGSLNDPCLSRFWTHDYQPIPGAIAMAALFLVTVVEMVFSPGRHCCGNAGNTEIYTKGGMEDGRGSCAARSDSEQDSRLEKLKTDTTGVNALMRRERPLSGNSSSLGRELAHLNADLVEMERMQTVDRGEPPMMENGKTVTDDNKVLSDDDESSIQLTPEQRHKKAVLQCMLLEMGILFHSVFIGMALAVSVGSDFMILLIAIAFHQTFEGLALGSRIAAIDWSHKKSQPWLMALAYGCTTPLGQAIGLATHTLYDPNSEVGLIMVGVMNAISSGLLLFASLVELLAEDFLSDASWRTLRSKRRVTACFLVFLGALGMSLVGAWA